MDDTPKQLNMTGYVIYEDGIIDRDLSFPGTIYGLTYSSIPSIEEDLYENIESGLYEEIVNLSGCGHLNYELHDVCFDSGQMSHPETGQWDIEPYWDFDLVIVNNEKTGLWD